PCDILGEVRCRELVGEDATGGIGPNELTRGDRALAARAPPPGAFWVVDRVHGGCEREWHGRAPELGCELRAFEVASLVGRRAELRKRACGLIRGRRQLIDGEPADEATPPRPVEAFGAMLEKAAPDVEAICVAHQIAAVLVRERATSR